jgi:hypothetical protein
MTTTLFSGFQKSNNERVCPERVSTTASAMGPSLVAFPLGEDGPVAGSSRKSTPGSAHVPSLVGASPAVPRADR